MKLKIFIVFLLFFIVGNSFCQNNPEKGNIQKPDLELTFLGGSVSLFKKRVKKHFFGLSFGLLNYGYILFDNPYSENKQKPIDDNRTIIEYGKIKVFYRYEISKRISVQSGLKYNYTMFGEENCDPCYDALVGLENSFVVDLGKIGYKFDISIATSFKTKKIITFINPFIICFNF